ncbi:hypothetical protein EVAR_3298_1 [Eumeta japonica]|uniref:Uncharacterized protein n=1 Tax=Eumeta variegata TaxID=151549 RepID=A0A4C1SV75_EUMVA|nr:hypothetical protein EVAR_3298_1 [Eumeta japonica]
MDVKPPALALLAAGSPVQRRRPGSKASQPLSRRCANIINMEVCIQYNARNSTALNSLRMMQCAGSTLLDSSFFCPSFLFYSITTLS